MLKTLTLATATAATALLGTTAMAATNANATTDLNLRAGPSPQAEIVDVIPGEGEVSVQECAVNSEWCLVDYQGTQGWAYSSYLTAPLNGEPTVIYQNVPSFEIETVEVPDDAKRGTSALAGGTAAGLAASLVAGPVGIAGAALAGTILGANSVPDQTVTYVRQNPVDPVYLNGEVVVGAQVPESVALATVPDSDYRYVYVNGVPAVVNAERQIVTIVR